MGKTLYLIDGHAQIFRAYHAIRTPLSSPLTGEPTQAVFGFAGMLLKLYNQCHPDYAAMVIDLPGPTFRDELYDQYKANRPPPPPDLIAQEKRIFDMTRMFGLPVLSQPGAEADDVIATLTRQVEKDPVWAGVDVRLVSRDKDLEQLLGERVVMFDIHTDTTLDVAGLQAEKGISPQQVVEMLALMGDSIDNVPGVDGVGPKTAAALIAQFGSIENIYANLEQIKGKRRENLEKARDQIKLSLQLVRLKDDLPIRIEPGDTAAGRIDFSGLEKFFTDMGFKRLASDLERLRGKLAGAAPATAGTTVTGAGKPAKKQQTHDGFAGSLFEAAAEESGGEEGPDAAQAGAPVGAPTAAAPGGDVVAQAPQEGRNLSTAAGMDYRAVTTAAELERIVEQLRGQKMIAVDTETIGLGHRAELCGLSLSWQAGSGVYVPVRSPQAESHLTAEQTLAILRPVLEDPAIPKCGHNIKYDLLVLRHAGLILRGVAFDSMVAAHLAGLPGLGMDELALSLLGHQTISITELIGHGGRGLVQKTMDQVDLPLIATYAAEDADVTLRLWQELAPRLKTMGLEDLAQRVEMPLVEVLAEMEANGIRVDKEELARQKEGLSRRMVELRDQIQEAAGRPFNPDSPKQLAEVLFKEMKLPVGKRTKTGPSTDSEVLEQLAEMENLTQDQARIPVLVLEYRQLTKLVNTYLEALAESVNSATGRVHASFHQTGTATGRLSSSGPNLQNIPIRTELGRQVRKAFVAERGAVLLSADYSQIELRILAHLSEDPGLIQAFERDQDIHRAVAAEVFNVPAEAVTKEQRGYAKVINFGIVYGVTAFGLARRIEGLDLQGAKVLIADYRRRFAGIQAFLDDCVKQANDYGYVTTMLGRRRAIAEVKATNPNRRALGERLAINTVVQGSAADLIKLAMVNLQRRIQKDALPMRLLLQIHDELVVESPQDQAETMAAIVKHEMESAMSLRVPLKVDVGSGADWLAAK
ncbi:MAG: DNA polymerase I [Phycisphaeraceae bacterium]|nr:DNA polymerase I [Phycisphaeraceae bacterium]